MNHKNHVKISSESNNLWFVFVLIIYFLITLMPFVAQITGGYVLMGVNALILVSVIFCSTDTVNEYFSFLIPVFLLAFFNLANRFLSTSTIAPLYIYQLMIDFVPLVAGYWIIKTNDKKITNILAWILFAALSVTVITTYIGVLSNPGAARYLATVSDSSDAYFVSLCRQNIGGFSFIYTVCIVFPMIIGFYKQKKINTLLMAIITVVLILYFLAAEYATATMLLLIEIFLIFQSKKLTLRRVLAFSLILILVFFVFSSAISSVFMWLSQNIGSATLAERFESAALELNGEDSDEESDISLRKDAYLTDLQGFLEHPLLGGWITGKIKSGGHSYLLGILSSYGLVGAGIVVFIYKKIFVAFYLPYKEKEYFGYMLWSFIIAIFISLINTGKWYFPIAVIIPTITAYLDNTKAKEAISDEGALDN